MILTKILGSSKDKKLSLTYEYIIGGFALLILLLVVVIPASTIILRGLPTVGEVEVYLVSVIVAMFLIFSQYLGKRRKWFTATFLVLFGIPILIHIIFQLINLSKLTTGPFWIPFIIITFILAEVIYGINEKREHISILTVIWLKFDAIFTVLLGLTIIYDVTQLIKRIKLEYILQVLKALGWIGGALIAAGAIALLIYAWLRWNQRRLTR